MIRRFTLRRVEVAVPIYNTDIKMQLIEMFITMLSDNVKARVLGSDGKYRRKEQKEPYIDSQNVFMQEALQAKPPQELPEKIGLLKKIKRIFHR